MKNSIKSFLFFTFIMLGFNLNASENYYVGNINIDEKELKCYYNYNGRNTDPEFAVVRQGSMYYFYVNGDEWFFISRDEISSYEHEGKKYYIGELKETVLEFSKRYSVCY